MAQQDNRAAQFLRRRFAKHGEQSEMAKRTGISQGTLSKLASLESGLPSMDTATKLVPEGVEFPWWTEAPLADVELTGTDHG